MKRVALVKEWNEERPFFPGGEGSYTSAVRRNWTLVLVCFMMLVEVLRLHLAGGLQSKVGWLSALSDKQISAAIASIHHDPAHDWTVEELAQRGGMSRSIFALRFKEIVGSSPIEYLKRWRMPLAADRISNTRDSISEIVQSLGYESASAFTKAF